MDRDMTIHPDPNLVFEDAIACGFLNDDLDSDNYAGRWMYMFHDAEGRAHFKHRGKRRYRVMPTCTHSTTPASTGDYNE